MSAESFRSLRILFTSPFVPFPPDSGGKLVPFHYMTGLAQRGHRVTSVVPLRRKDDAGGAHELGRYLDLVPVDVGGESELVRGLKGALRGDSIRIARHRLARVRDSIGDVLVQKRFDIAVLDTLFTAYLIPEIRLRSQSLPILLIEHNVESLLARRFAARSLPVVRPLLAAETYRIRKSEAAALRNADGAVALSAQDREEMLRLVPGARVFVIPPGARTFPGEWIGPPAHPLRCLFIGGFRWPPNRDAALWMARRVFPAIKIRVPGAELVVAGEAPTGRILSLESRSDGIRVSGRVPEAHEEVRAAGVCVVPIRFGGGVRLKILEALANERPVVTTSIGCEGLPFRDGEHLLVADAPETFASAVVRLLLEPTYAASLARRGRAIIEDRFGWGAILDLVEDTIRRCSTG